MDKVCKIEDCPKKAYTSGMCNSHYVSVRFAGIKCSVVGCEDDAARSGNRCITHYSEWLYSPEGRANKRRQKVQDQIGYNGAHARLTAAKGRPRTYKCVDCSNAASEWSLKHDSEERLVSRTGLTAGSIYSTNVDDYEPRCLACHRRYDSKYGNKKSGLPLGATPRMRPETKAKADIAIRLVKQGKTTTAAGEIVGISAGAVSRYFHLLEGISIREWQRAQKAGAAK